MTHIDIGRFNQIDAMARDNSTGFKIKLPNIQHLQEKLYSTNRTVKRFMDAANATDYTLGSVNLVTETVANTPGVKHVNTVITSQLNTARDNPRRTAAPDSSRPLKLKSKSTKKAGILHSLDQSSKHEAKKFISVVESSNCPETKGESDIPFHLEETFDEYGNQLSLAQHDNQPNAESAGEENIDLSNNISKDQPVGATTNSSVHKFNLLQDWRWVDIDDVGNDGSQTERTVRQSLTQNTKRTTAKKEFDDVSIGSDDSVIKKLIQIKAEEKRQHLNKKEKIPFYLKDTLPD